MNEALKTLYETHHQTRRGEGFVLAGEARGTFIRKAIGTGKQVLDIGCRDGALTKYFVTGNMVLGVDIDEEALSRAHAALGIETDHVDLTGPWPFPERSFDAVVAAEVLEHLYYPSIVIHKIGQVLKAGGIFVATVPNAFSLVNRVRYLLKRKRGTPLEDPTHINHFTVRELRSILKKEGFVDIYITGHGRLGPLATLFTQTFAFGLMFSARKP